MGFPCAPSDMKRLKPHNNVSRCWPQVELTGDNTPDARALLSADIIVATPEKWDGISRSWQARAYVTKVALVVIDEIHLLGADRGPILEASG